jgi:hypothetical protein
VATNVTYRVHRTITGSGTPAIVAKVIDISSLTGANSGQVGYVDPYVWPGTGYTYWVEAINLNGTVSPPSAISSVTVGRFGVNLSGFPTNIGAPIASSVSGTKTISILGNTMQGSDVTWTWQLTTSPVVVYHVSYELNPTTSIVPTVGGPFFRTEVPVPFDPQIASGPPSFTMGVPQGQTARFCVWVYADPDLTKPLPPERVCTDTKVP